MTDQATDHNTRRADAVENEANGRSSRSTTTMDKALVLYGRGACGGNKWFKSGCPHETVPRGSSRRSSSGQRASKGFTRSSRCSWNVTFQVHQGEFFGNGGPPMAVASPTLLKIFSPIYYPNRGSGKRLIGKTRAVHSSSAWASNPELPSPAREERVFETALCSVSRPRKWTRCTTTSWSSPETLGEFIGSEAQELLRSGMQVRLAFLGGHQGPGRHSVLDEVLANTWVNENGIPTQMR